MLYITIWLIGSRTSYHLSVCETAHLTNARGQAHLLNPTYAPAVSSETDLNSKHGDRLVNMCLQITINSVILQVNRRKISLNALIKTHKLLESFIPAARQSRITLDTALYSAHLRGSEATPWIHVSPNSDVTTGSLERTACAAVKKSSRRAACSWAFGNSARSIS